MRFYKSYFCVALLIFIFFCHFKAQANIQIPPISFPSHSIAKGPNYKRKRPTNDNEEEPIMLSDITNVIPTARTQTHQSHLTPNLDRTTPNTRIYSTNMPPRTDDQVFVNPCAPAKRLRKNDSFTCKSSVFQLVSLSSKSCSFLLFCSKIVVFISFPARSNV